LLSNPAAVGAEAVGRTYRMAGREVAALTAVDIRVAVGEAVAVVGPSGSGKSTLLHLVAGLDRPTSGDIAVFGIRLSELSESDLTHLRATKIGYVFQDAHLLPGLTALENVVAARLPWRPRKELVSEARQLLDAVGLGNRIDHAPDRLSGGEKQRVSLARALVGRPSLLIADEPTGNLDAETTEGLLGLLETLRSSLRLTVLLATHDTAVAASADRVVRLVGGRVAGELPSETSPGITRVIE
jgi:predicted ABC-type transport system involved in lysophospholipase L1 biosynthesis ATPase subunit